jgi:RNA polymerase sigma factor for flagellar operon FliA
LDYRKLLLQHLELVDRLVRFVARRHHLSPADAEEFAAVVRLKLVDRNFAILRKFEARSTIATYLTVVVERLCLDFCVAKLGKWRPSASARRLGPVAMLLERLLVRDGITFDEAVGTLQTNHGVTCTRTELYEMLLQLPARGGGLPCAAGEAVASRRIPGDYLDDERAMQRVEAALARAIARLAADDRRILHMRFEEALTAAEIARSLGVERKPVYRRLQRIIRLLRADLLDQGIDQMVISRIIGHPALSLHRLLIDSDA